MVDVRRSARDRRAPTRYEPQEHPIDDFSDDESGSESGSGSETDEDGEIEAGDGDSDDDTVGSLRDFVVPDTVGDDADNTGDSDMLGDSDLEGYTSTEADDMDWSPGGSSRTDSESESGSDDGSDSEDD